MRPITDEIILSLIERAERRQSARSPANDTTPLSKPAAVVSKPRKEKVISLDFVRRSQRKGRTISGVFCYAPRA